MTVAPVHLHISERYALILSDGVALTVVVAVMSAFHAGLPAFFAALSVLLIATAIGRYAISYAFAPQEELYSTLAVAFLAAPLAAVATAIVLLPWYQAFCSVLAWSIVAGFLARTCRVWFGSRGMSAGRGHHTRDHRVRAGAIAAERAVIRALDVLFACAALLLAAPLIALISLVIVADDGAPVLFKQKRAGCHAIPFVMLKFRTMRLDADGAWAKPGDARITRAGRVLRRGSLDELPQLWNVVRGEMSLVGPRPEMCEYADAFAQRFPGYHERHAVVPGITGWAQIRFRRNFQPDAVPEVLELDVFGVRHQSVHLYLFCIAMTACEVFSHGAV